MYCQTEAGGAAANLCSLRHQLRSSMLLMLRYMRQVRGLRSCGPRAGMRCAMEDAAGFIPGCTLGRRARQPQCLCVPAHVPKAPGVPVT